VSLARGLAGQVEVVWALVLRETRTRFGKNQLGYLWALFEPLLMIGTFYVLFTVAGRSPGAGMDVYTFVATGFVPYLMFRSTADRIAASIDSNRGLLFYPHVQPLDLVAARGALEMGTYLAVFALLMGVHALFHQQLVVDDVLLVLLGFSLAWGLGVGLGLVFSALGVISSAVDRTRGALLRPFFWASGIFFTANELPGGAREVLLYNPVLHAVELVRGGWFDDYTLRYADPLYVVKWIFALVLLGLVLERVVRRRIEVS
jgi:capsular polysaccharide transport system permease protein